MKNILFLFVSVFALAQNPNHQTFLNHNWRLNFVQDGNNTPVYVPSNINYPMQVDTYSDLRLGVSICSLTSLIFVYVENENTFAKTMAVSLGPGCQWSDQSGPFFNSFVENVLLFSNVGTHYPFVLTPIANNQYALDIYDPSGKRLNFNSTGLAANSNESISFDVFPNPVSDVLNITSNTNINNLSLYNMKGQLVFETDTYFQQIDMTAFHSGIYFLKVVGENEQVVFKKVVKN